MCIFYTYIHYYYYTLLYIHIIIEIYIIHTRLYAKTFLFTYFINLYKLFVLQYRLQNVHRRSTLQSKIN